MLRVFFAVPLQFDNEVLKFFSDTREDFKGERIVWVKPEGMHLTLHFFGEQTDEMVQKILRLSENELKTMQSFSLQYIKPLIFGGIRNPKVIGLELSCPKEMTMLKKKVDNLVKILGLEVETRAFVPHLTFGRVKEAHHSALYADYLKQTIYLPELPINNLILYQSFLSPQGAVYKSLWKSV